MAQRYGTSFSDENRLFYVAMTIAMDSLVLSSFEQSGKLSKFLSPEIIPHIDEIKKSSDNVVKFAKEDKRRSEKASYS